MRAEPRESLLPFPIPKSTILFFNYETSSYANEVVLLYDSPCQLCPVLWGTIEGAAERFGEQVEIFEQSCMKKGAPLCRLRAVFSAPLADPLRYTKTLEQLARQEGSKQHLLSLSTIYKDEQKSRSCVYTTG